MFGMSAFKSIALGLGAVVFLALVGGAAFYLVRIQQAQVGSLEGDNLQLQEQLNRQREQTAGLEYQVAVLAREAEVQQAELEGRIQTLEEELTRSGENLAALDADLSRCRRALNATYLVVAMKWITAGHDMDLHVVDPGGTEFSFDRPNIDGRDFPWSYGELSVGMNLGPGIEIWEIPHAAPGIYKIYFTFYSRIPRSDRTAVASGTVFYRGGSFPIQEIHMERVREKYLVAEINVSSHGEVQVRHPVQQAEHHILSVP